MIKKIVIKNFKTFRDFELDLNEEINIIVGDNEAGKSTILEAVNIALTLRLNGKLLQTELSPYLFNKPVVDEYIRELRAGHKPELPKIVIELYLSVTSGSESLKGTNNTKGEDEVGVKVEVVFDSEYADEYEKFIEDPAKVTTVPTEYFKVNWYSFAHNSITSRSLPIGVSFIDATTIRLQNGTDYYLQSIINEGLDPKERVALSIVYRGLKESFINDPSIQGINEKLVEKKGAITDKDLAVSIDISNKTNWETNLIPYLDSLPFHLVGKGEQNALKILLALERKVDDDIQVILIEEPENHLSFSSMNKLINKIKEKCKGKQILITTHSAYVLNKLGLENLILLANQKTMSLSNLPVGTQDYFKKLSGYDTLRLVLAKKTILVEGPSDELIVQKAYLLKHSKLPIEDEVDVLNVRGLSFSRFLDIAKELQKDIVVVTDNDGDYKINVDDKYQPYASTSNIKICRSEDNIRTTLEPQLVGSNTVALINKVLGKAFATEEGLVSYMTNNKTECALKIFETKEKITFPTYIDDAIG